MIFSSLVFLCVFLPTVFFLYTVIPNLRIRNGLLIAASLVFYACGEPIYVFLMLLSSLMNYVCARLVEHGTKRKRQVFLVCSVVCNLGILGVFKYAGFAVTTLNGIFQCQIPVPQIALPIGISFFTFQALSYVIDVYRKQVDAQKNYFRVLLYIAFFPQLIAGPIVQYKDINAEINQRKQDLETIARGFRRFVCGLAKKVLIANTVGQTADLIFNATEGWNILSVWIGAIAYLFQIYYDFSGYSDMAIGLGQMFGFHFKENFQYPYGATSVQVFWRRWHISLSTWFKEYLYIPLGGNRKGKGRAVLNRLIVFFCTGLWHGANWTFILWGLYHGLFLLLEQFFPILQKLPRWLGHCYTVLVVCVGFVLFRADTITQALQMIGQMFGGFHFEAASMSLALRQLTPWFLIIVAVAILGAAPIRPLADRIRSLLRDGAIVSSRKRAAVEIVLYSGAFVLLGWCMLRLSSNTYNPFIYFQF